MRTAAAAILGIGFLSALAMLAASQTTLAPSPPMGWNSWDAFGTTVTEDEVKANANAMAERLARHGWQYIVVDIQWSETNPKTHGYRPNADLAMDANGRLIPAPHRFPSSTGGKGFAPLAAYIHSKGLKFGIHIMRGIPRRAVAANLPIAGSTAKAADVADTVTICPWNSDMYGIDVKKPGGQEYYDSIVRLYASWGVDFIKADDMFGPDLNGARAAEIEALSRAIGKSGRPIVLSLSPGLLTTDGAGLVGRCAQMWRISDDFWDRWVDLKAQFANLAKWAPYARPGNWPDADMLPLGHIGIRAERGDPRMSLLTHDEQITLMTLWSVARSPLMFGGNLPDNDAFTLSLLTNDEVLSVNQHATASRQLFARGNQVAWMAGIAGSPEKYLAVFNIGDKREEEVWVNWTDLGLMPDCAVRDLWARKDAGEFALGRGFRLAPHAAGFYKVTPVAR